MSSIRKKRNFKGLQLNDSPLSVPAPQPSASGTGLGKSSTSSSSSSLAGSSSNATTSAATSNNTLTLGSSTTAGTRGGAATGSGDVVEPSSGANYHNTLTEQLKNLELGVEYKLDLKNEDLKVLSELGSGNGGTVTRVLHEKSNTVMARKTVFIDAKPAVRKQILRELQILHECNSPYIVSFYGAYLSEPHICMCMEFMDKSSLDTIWKKWGPIPADICGLVAVTVVQGLTYLYDVHRIIHRDVKPSNILVNAKGEIKICDFGVSGELINSIADTFVGTSTYMSPERIQGDQYSVKSDVWSLGITIIEIALGRFPFAEDDEENDDGDSEDSDDDSDDDDTEGDEDSDDHLRTTLSPTKPNGARNNANMQRTATLAATASSSKEKKTHRRRRSKKKPGVSLAGGAGQMSMLELLQRIVNEPPPRLPIAPSIEEEEGGSSEDVTIDSSAARTQQRRQRQHRRTRRPRGFPPDLVRFVDLCVTKDPSARPTPKELASGVGAVGEYVRRCEERRERGETDVKGWVDGLR